jgi:hypothetical protein
MTLKELKEKIAQIDYKTGAKKAAKIVTIVTALAVLPTVATAAVPAENIIGDAQVAEDRSVIKTTDARDITKEFYGFNKYGNQTITMDEVRKAIELSDILNGYFFDPVLYTNTTKEEVLSLDIDKLYEEYIIARYNDQDRTAEFCQRHLEDKPAIDAYVTFVCGTVSNNIQASVAEFYKDINRRNEKEENEFAIEYAEIKNEEKCPLCGTLNDADSKFCSRCGEKLKD